MYLVTEFIHCAVLGDNPVIGLFCCYCLKYKWEK